MNTETMTHLLSMGQSVAKVAAEGGQLIADKLSIYGFFAFCLALVLVCLIVPAHLYEKYYKVTDDPALPAVPNTTNSANTTNTTNNTDTAA